MGKKNGNTWNRMSECHNRMVEAIDRKRAGHRPPKSITVGYRRGCPDGPLMTCLGDLMQKAADVPPEPVLMSEVVRTLIGKIGSLLIGGKVLWQSQSRPNLLVSEDGEATVELSDVELEAVGGALRRKWNGEDRKYLGIRLLSRLAGY